MALQRRDNCSIMLRTLAALGFNDERRKAAVARGSYPGCIRAIRYHYSDLGSRQASGRDRFRDGQKVRPAAGHEDPEFVFLYHEDGHSLRNR